MFDRCSPRLSSAGGSAFATANAHAPTIRSNAASRCLAGQQLRVTDPGRVEARRDHHPRGDQRPRERAPAASSTPAIREKPCAHSARLVPVEPGVYSHPHLDGGYTITNAFPITVSSGTYPSPVGGGNRESPECARLSPSTKSMPSGTVTGPKGRVSTSGSR